ncbi:MAG: hypothetical protein EOP49_15990 [Sphingobacteriales bacterium]|nr:MAG: hypothetical protein EOP49_15990 [Sphingobacteriales bacterium]
MRLILFLLCLIQATASANGTDSFLLIRSIPLEARLLSVDELGNAYVVKSDNSLLRLNASGDSSAFYRSVQHGAIGRVDPTNPLNVLVYFPDFSRVVMLDRMLSPKNDIDLRRMNVPVISAIGASADGNIWIYDRFNARVRKIDEVLNPLVESNDLRQELHMVPESNFLVERDWKLYLADSLKGIFTFDRYGSYINTISIAGVSKLQVTRNQLVYRQRDSLLVWDMDLMQSRSLKLPGEGWEIIDAAANNGRLYILYNNRLDIFSIAKE